MKKILSFLLVAMLVFSLCACSMDDTPGKEYVSNNDKTTENKPDTKDETFGINETAVFDALKFTATEIKESKGTGFFEPDEGNVFVGIKFIIENTSDQEQSVSTLLLFNGYVDDIKCAYSFNASCAFDEGTLDGEIAPGKKLVGWYALEVPQDWSNIELDVQQDWLSNSTAKFVFTK